MLDRIRPLSLFFVLMSTLWLAGCAVVSRPAPVYQNEIFAAESPFEYYSGREPEGACEIGKRALLSQGYQIEDGKPQSLRGDKYFQPTPERVTKLTISLVCLPSSQGAVIYANALETHYELKSRGNSTGLSVAGVGSLSVPWAMDRDTLVKVGEATVTEPEFYRRFFELIKTIDG